jgi:hypothetical protein
MATFYLFYKEHTHFILPCLNPMLLVFYKENSCILEVDRKKKIQPRICEWQGA